MKTALLKLRDKLGSDATYFQQIYNYAFEFSRPPGQRSLGLDMAQGFWALLIPHGLQGGALSHIPTSREDGSGDDRMEGIDDGWQDEHTQWWFEFLTEKKVKGVSKDVWQMVSLATLLLCTSRLRSSSSWSSYDLSTLSSRTTMKKVSVTKVCSAVGSECAPFAAAWPSTIDDFVEYAKSRVASG